MRYARGCSSRATVSPFRWQNHFVGFHAFAYSQPIAQHIRTNFKIFLVV